MSDEVTRFDTADSTWDPSGQPFVALVPGRYEIRWSYRKVAPGPLTREGLVVEWTELVRQRYPGDPEGELVDLRIGPGGD